jgi:hypothetical protein
MCYILTIFKEVHLKSENFTEKIDIFYHHMSLKSTSTSCIEQLNDKLYYYSE